ncbi:unnamed protein product [Prunus armeniaca]
MDLKVRLAPLACGANWARLWTSGSVVSWSQWWTFDNRNASYLLHFHYDPCIPFTHKSMYLMCSKTLYSLYKDGSQCSRGFIEKDGEV